MPENPPRPLSESKQRKIAHTQAKEGAFHKRTKESLAKAKEARDRAKYVEQGEIERLVLGTRGAKYDAAAYKAAPVDETGNIPEKGAKRRKAARVYSRTHDFSGQIKKEQERLEDLTEKTKELERGSLSRLILGTRGKKYNRALYNKETTKEEIQEALAKAEREQIPFHPPVPKKIIDITPPAIQEEAPRTTRPYVEQKEPLQADMEPLAEEKQNPDNGEEAFSEEPPDLSAEAHIGRVSSTIASAEEALLKNEKEAVAAAGRLVRAEQRGFAADVARTGKTGKNVFWTRIWSFIKGASIPFALLAAAASGKSAIDNYNTRPAVSRSVSGEDGNHQSIAQAQLSAESAADTVSFEEAHLPVESELVADEEQALTPEERQELLRQNPEGYEPSGAEEARLRALAAAQEPVRGVEPPSASEE